VFFNRLGELRDRTYENQRHKASGLNLVVAAIILWNTVYLERATTALRAAGHELPDDKLIHVAPLSWERQSDRRLRLARGGDRAGWSASARADPVEAQEIGHALIGAIETGPPDQCVGTGRSNRGKTRGSGTIIRFPRRRESDSLRACRCPRTLTIFRLLS
jgi:hypothetical protein